MNVYKFWLNCIFQTKKRLSKKPFNESDRLESLFRLSEHNSKNELNSN